MGAQKANPPRKVLHHSGSRPRRDAARRWFGSVISGTASFVFHLVLLLILACLLINWPRSPAPDTITVSFEPTLETELDDVIEEIEGEVSLETEDLYAASLATAPFQPETSSGISPADLEFDTSSSDADSSDEVIVQPMLVPVGRAGRRGRDARTGGRAGVADDWNFPSGVGYEGRQPGVRTQLALLNGGTLASERAVDAGLEWLARHQRPDGAWSFQHLHADCGADCDHPGSIDGSTAATGMALLCFMGAGHTHLDDGPWRETVTRGLEWLAAQSRVGDLRCSIEHARPEQLSGMYAQGIATMALCEAVGMTHDRTYRKPAEDAVQFIVEAQDRYGGGWRYEPYQAGDTSVLGWQVMALVSGRMSGLDVPDTSRELAVVFLESVHNQSTDRFGYTSRARGTTATTAIGQLCSMYLRSSLPPERIRLNTSQLAVNSPLNNEYSNFYTTQVLFQIGGPTWEAWNESLRDGLIRTQRNDGHAAGSWDPRGGWTAQGGRLYTTAIHVLTLEVYYRHLPLYDGNAFDILRPETAQDRRRREVMDHLGAEPDKDDAPAATVEPTPVNDPRPEVLAGLEAPSRYILNYPTAHRFCGPLESTFEDAERTSAETGDGQRVQIRHNGGFGLPMLQVGGQTYLHTGADYGWYQAGAPVHAVAAGVVRLSADPPAVPQGTDAGDASPRRRQLREWGSTVIIEHRLPDGEYLTTLSAHLGLDRHVRTGDIVAAGQQIGTIGPNRADVNGGFEPHLHFGLRRGRIAESGATLFTLTRGGQTVTVTLDEAGEDTTIVRFSEGASPLDGVALLDDGTLYVDRREDGRYLLPSWLMWQTIPPETRLAGYAPDLEGWLDPTLFLREHHAMLLPASRFALTRDLESNNLPNVAGEPAPGWVIDEWLRQPAGGVELSQLRGRTIVMVCVQHNCPASKLLAVPMMADAAARFADADDVSLILHQTAFTDFRFNTPASFGLLLEQLPPHVALAHSGNALSRPVILDDYGVRGTPWTLIIGPDGIVEFSGCLLDSSELIRMVEELREGE